MTEFNASSYLSQCLLDNVDMSLFESHIEITMYKHISKVIAKDTEIILQKVIVTPNGDFRLDIALKHNDDIIAIECDGKDFHSSDRQIYRDEWRDTLILYHSDVSSIFRFRGCDIEKSVENIVYFIFTRYSEFFDEVNIKRYSSLYHMEFDYRYNTSPSLYSDRIYICCDNTVDENQKQCFIPIWKNIDNSWSRFYDKLLLISLLHQGLSMDELFEMKDQYMALSTEQLVRLIQNNLSTE